MEVPTYACIQWNGERLLVERWVLVGVQSGTVKDPMLVRIVRGAVAIRPHGWPVQYLRTER